MSGVRARKGLVTCRNTAPLLSYLCFYSLLFFETDRLQDDTLRPECDTLPIEHRSIQDAATSESSPE